MSSKEKSKKSVTEPRVAQPGEICEFIRLARVQIPNSHHAAYQIEKVAIANGILIHRAFYGQPDVLEMTLAKVQDALDPESVVDSRPVGAVVA